MMPTEIKRWSGFSAKHDVALPGKRELIEWFYFEQL